MTTPNVLSDLVPLCEYQRTRANMFPSANSLQWFVRMNRDALNELGAIVAPAGRRLVKAEVFEVFDQAVLDIGKQRQLKRA